MPIKDFDQYFPYEKRLDDSYNLPYIMKGVITPKTFELSTEMVRYAWLKREDLRTIYPFATRFVNYKDPTDDIYQWAHKYMPFEMPELVIDRLIDWGKTEMELYPEYKFIDLTETKKKVSWFESLKLCLEYLLNFCRR